MTTKIVIGFLVVALIANGILGYFTYVQKEDINTLVEKLATARQEAVVTDALQAEQLETARQEITSLTGENATHITGLEEGVEANLDSINEEAGRVTTLGNNLSSLSTRVNGIVPGLAADDVYRQARMAVVEISDGDDTVGAGFIWEYGHDDNSYVLTACHVVEDLIETKIRVILADGTISKASIAGSSIRSDVALLELESSTDLAPATLADSDRVTIGSHALVIGHPFEEDNSLTVGVVSQLNRFEGIGYGQDERWIANLIQFDAPANPGNSGGPVFNEDGDVIGMVIAGINPFMGEGISLAVCSKKLNAVAFRFLALNANTLMPLGQYNSAVLGIQAKDVSPTEAKAAGRETILGALVEYLVPGYTADKNGIQVGDIIVAIDNYPISNVGELASYLCLHVGAEATIHLVRNGTEIELTMLVGTAPDELWESTKPAGQWF